MYNHPSAISLLLCVSIALTPAASSFSLPRTHSALSLSPSSHRSPPSPPPTPPLTLTPTALHAAANGANGATESYLSTLPNISGGATATTANPSGGGDPDDVVVEGPKSELPSSVFNLVKNIVGAGVLGLPAGVAAFGNSPSALYPAVSLILFLGLLSGYSFSLIGRVCAMTGASTYRSCWDESVDSKTSFLPAWACTLKTGLACIAYSMILADTFKNLLATAGFAVARHTVLLTITSFVLLPLCFLKDLASLAPFSILGIAGMGYTILAMGLRYLTGGYSLPLGKYLSSLSATSLPTFGKLGASAALSPNSAILICMLSTSYLAHYNAPKYYQELRDNTLPRFNKVVTYGFGGAAVMSALVAAFGFLTFGGGSQGLILNNYSNKDAMMGLSRIAVALSVVFSYPLAFVGLRDGALDLLNVGKERRTVRLINRATVAILSFVTCIALKLKDLSFLLSFGGATLGNAVVFVFPAMMFIGAVRKRDRKDAEVEVGLAKGLIAAGVVLGGVGGKMALKAL